VPGRAHGFVTNVHHFNNNEFTLFFTITEAGGGDTICVCDWTGKRRYLQPVLTNDGRPENCRMAEFQYGNVGAVLEYVQTLIANFILKEPSAEIAVPGMLGVGVR